MVLLLLIVEISPAVSCGGSLVESMCCFLNGSFIMAK